MNHKHWKDYAMVTQSAEEDSGQCVTDGKYEVSCEWNKRNYRLLV